MSSDVSLRSSVLTFMADQNVVLHTFLFSAVGECLQIDGDSAAVTAMLFLRPQTHSNLYKMGHLSCAESHIHAFKSTIDKGR